MRNGTLPPASQRVPFSAKDYYAPFFVHAERISLTDVDLTVPPYFARSALIVGAVQVRFRSQDRRLYVASERYFYRPLIDGGKEVVLPYETIVPDTGFAYALSSDVTALRPDGAPACQPAITDATLVDADPYLNPQRASLWRGADGTMLIVLFPANYRCPADGMIDPRYRIIPAGSTPWRTIRIASNLHLPPEVTLISAASVGEPISFARVGLSEAAISFPRE